MGFNIGVKSKQIKNDYDCRHFIDRRFFNFVQSYEIYHDESIIIQCGIYYELDLLPLTKLVYTWDELTEQYINEHIQKIDFLLELIEKFKNKILDDNTVCDKITYAKLVNPFDLFQVEQETTEILQLNELFQKEINDNPNPWEWYFKEGNILTDLDNLRSYIQCYKDKGASEIYLTAG